MAEAVSPPLSLPHRCVWTLACPPTITTITAAGRIGDLYSGHSGSTAEHDTIVWSEVYVGEEAGPTW